MSDLQFFELSDYTILNKLIDVTILFKLQKISLTALSTGLKNLKKSLYKIFVLCKIFLDDIFIIMG